MSDLLRSMSQRLHQLRHRMPQDASDIIAVALHNATNSAELMAAKRARKIIEQAQNDCANRQIGDEVHLMYLGKSDLTPEASEAVINNLVIPTRSCDFAPKSAAYLVAAALRNQGFGFLIEILRCEERLLASYGDELAFLGKSAFVLEVQLDVLSKV